MATDKKDAPKARKRGGKVESTMAKPWKPENVGDCLEGTYEGSEMVSGKGSRGDFASYHVRKVDGERVRVASAMLNSKMNQVPKGTYIWLTYVGDFETSNGKSPDYDLECEEGTRMIDPFDGAEAS